LDVDHITDRLHFVAASIPAGWGVTVESAAALLLEQQQAGQRMADLIQWVINGQPVDRADWEAAIIAWDAL
jgi:hypothetical protein